MCAARIPRCVTDFLGVCEREGIDCQEGIPFVRKKNDSIERRSQNVVQGQNV